MLTCGHFPQPIKTTPSASAQTAATQAFLASQNSNANLSAAAAAAALRSHTTTPTPVGQIQTKRMIQRNGSTSSFGSAAGNARPGGGLQRQNSSGSMTERTFRDQSPSRGPSPRGQSYDTPPVPALPKGYVSPPPPVPQKSHRRASSMEPPLRVSSPPPKKVGGRGVSLDRGPGVMTTRRTGPSAQRVTSLGSVAELERTGSKGSINFSRPISSPNSPPTSPINDRRTTTMSSGQPTSRPTTTTMAPGEVRYLQQSLQGATNPPAKKKIVTTGEGAQARNSPMQSDQRQPTDSGVAASVPKKMKKKIGAREESDEESKPTGFTTSYGSDSDATAEYTAPTERPPTFNTRAALLLSKQPSVVREDREAEEREERNGAGLGKVRPDLTAHNSSKANGKKWLYSNSTSQERNRSSSQPAPTLATTNVVPTARKLSGSDATPARGNDTIRGGRHQSLSPARAAHFPVQPILKTPNGVRHQPPPRSVSPAKSAMKLSPSPRAISPLGGGHAPSETSDTMSMLSEDGIRSRKKKNRVSFDDDAVVVVPGRTASPPISSDSQTKGETARSWFGIGHGKKQTGSSARSQVEEDDEVIKPTPALPSFGSIRGHEEREGTGVSDQPSSPSVEPHHTLASWAQETLARIDLSSDQAVGAILSQDFVTKSTASRQEPLAPQVTSVEGTGYGSDSEGSVYSTDKMEKAGVDSGVTGNISEAHAAPYRELASPRHGDEGDYQYASKQSNDAVPSIAVLPATPAEDALRGAEWVGDSPMSTGSYDFKHESHGVMEHHPTDPTPATIGIAEPEPEGVLASREPVTPVVGGVAEALRTQTEHEDDADDGEDTGESIYSDAAEDLSDLEGDGFGSINAIVESPIVDTFGMAMTTPPDSPSGRLATPVQAKKSKLSRLASNDSQPGTEEGWDKTQAYWSGLSESRKSQLERAAAQESVDEGFTQPALKPKKKKTVAKKDLPATGQEWPEQYAEQTARSRSPRMTDMKQSMRDGSGTTAEAPHIRKSMRTGDTLKPAIRQTPQSRPMDTTTPQEPRGTLQKKYRPVSAVPLVNYNTPSYQNTPSHTRTASGGSAAASATPLTPKQVKKRATPAVKPRRVKSDDSDSESSFRKLRPSTADSGRYTMRKSMRGAPPEQPQLPTTSRAGPLSVRTSSPTGSTSRRPFSSGGHGMKTSLRGSGESSTLRPERTKSPIRGFGFGRGSKAKDQNAPSKSRSRFSSKFGDSSDDDDGPSTFRSRFGESSDEDEPPKRPLNLAPVRGIPKRADEGDSTDLDDSSDNEKRPKRRGMPSKAKATKPEGIALAAGSLRRNGSGRDLTKLNELGTGLQAKKAAEKDPKRRSFFGLGRKKDDSRVKKPDLPGPAARDGTPQRNNVLPPGTPTSPRSPKLQRRNTPLTLDSNSWPLPPVLGAADDRPNTADGVANTARPDLGVRSSTMDTPSSKTAGQNGVVLGRSGKKKRFPMLRKAFGLHD